MEGAGQAAGGRYGGEVVGQRTVEADVEGPAARLHGGPVFGEGELGLSRAGRAGDPQPIGIHLELARPVGEPAGDPRDHAAGATEEGAHVRLEADHVGRRRDVERVRRRAAREQAEHAHLLADVDVPLVAGLHDGKAHLVERGGLALLDLKDGNLGLAVSGPHNAVAVGDNG